MKDQPSIKMLYSIGAVLVAFFAGWLGWNSLKTIGLGEQAAAAKEWQDHTAQGLKDYQDKEDRKTDKLVDDMGQVKVDTATLKEIVKLIGERYQINSQAVEARVIRETRGDEVSSTTAKK